MQYMISRIARHSMKMVWVLRQQSYVCCAYTFLVCVYHYWDIYTLRVMWQHYLTLFDRHFPFALQIELMKWDRLRLTPDCSKSLIRFFFYLVLILLLHRAFYLYSLLFLVKVKTALGFNKILIKCITIIIFIGFTNWKFFFLSVFSPSLSHSQSRRLLCLLFECEYHCWMQMQIKDW